MKNLIYLLVAYLSSFSSLKIYSQVNQEWIQRYIGFSNSVNSIATDVLGNVYVTRASQDSVALIKYNSSGIQQWVQKYNTWSERPCLAVDNSGNVIISTGTTVKYNSSGTLLWERSFTGCYGRVMAVDSSDNVYVAGGFADSLYDEVFIIIKYNSSGVEQWSRKYHVPNNSGNDGVTAIDTDDSGNVVVTGYTYVNSDSANILTIKYNSSGDRLWANIYENGGICLPFAVKQDESGNVYAGAEAGDSGVIIKYNSIGILQWEINDGGARWISLDAIGNIFAFGWDKDGNSYAVKKYNSSGVRIWKHNFTGFPGTYGSVPMSTDDSGNVDECIGLFITVQEQTGRQFGKPFYMGNV